MFDFLTKKFKSESAYSPVDRRIIKAYNRVRPDGAKDLLCYVPFNSLTFSWQGKIYACTYNRNIVVGEYPANSIREIWHGERLQKLRDHIAHNDLNYGCQHCKYFFEKEKFTGLKPQVFDKYSDYAKYPYPRIFEFETSNTCNLECIMCNGNTSSSIRKNRDKLPPLHSPYDEAFVEQLEEFIPHLKEAKFFGGEPFLIPAYFRIWESMLKLNPSINIFVITNGTILTDKVKKLLEPGNFELAVSIDSIRKERFEHIRKNANYESVFEHLDYFNEYAHRKGRKISISFTTQLDNWDELPEVIQFCNSKDIVFFNSFLTSPAELSLVFLPSEKLHKIYQYLSQFSLPENTPIEKQNKAVFNDYLNYIKRYKEKNRNGIDFSEPKDNYDQYTSQSDMSDTSGTKNIYADKSELFNEMRAYANENAVNDIEEQIDKIIKVFDYFNDARIESEVFKNLSRMTMQKIINDVKARSADVLIAEVQRKHAHQR